MKKIVFFQPDFRAAGVEKVNILLANEMYKKGLGVKFIVFNKSGEFLDQLDPNIEVFSFNISRAIYSFPKLLKFFSNNKVVFISSYNHLSIIALIANILTLNRTRIYICEHNTLSALIQAKGGWKHKITAGSIRFLYPKAAGVIAVSKGVADDLADYTKIKRNKITVLYNPVVSDELKQKSQVLPKHKWLTNNNQPVFIASGRLELQKNFSLLINAFSQVVKCQDARLLILGEGSLRSQLQSQIDQLGLQEKCELFGYVDNPYSYMAKADVFVLSSDFEGFGNVIVEAMAVGTPIVSTDCRSGPSEILENGKWGKLVPVGDVSALAEAMIDSLNEEQNINLTERASFFTVEASTKKYLDFIGSK